MKFGVHHGLSDKERARRHLAKLSPAVSGRRGHDQTFHVAATLIHRYDLSEPDALELLREWNRGCVPPWSEPQLLHKVCDAARASGARLDRRDYPPENRWPSLKEALRVAIAHDGDGQADLWESSPVRADWGGSRTDDIIDLLFTPESLLCAGLTSSVFDTRPRSQWRRGELGRRQFIVPSPMSAATGLTRDGLEGYRRVP